MYRKASHYFQKPKEMVQTRTKINHKLTKALKAGR